jgi:hypothetical protein
MTNFKCPECGSLSVIASTKEVLDKTRRFFNIPCWFCDDCFNEEPVSPGDAEQWIIQYYATIMFEQPVKPRPMRAGIHNCKLDFSDDYKF